MCTICATTAIEKRLNETGKNGGRLLGEVNQNQDHTVDL